MKRMHVQYLHAASVTGDVAEEENGEGVGSGDSAKAACEYGTNHSDGIWCT